MSWVGGYNKKPSESDLRESRRRQLELERIERREKRAKYNQQLQAAIQAQREADQAFQDILNLDPDIFAEDQPLVQISDKEIENILTEEVMEDFEVENGTDGEKALDKLGTLKCEFDKTDLEYWFSELEGQLETIEVKSQWLKRTALQRYLPAEMKLEVKSLLKLTKTQAGTDIYKKIKTELLSLFGAKPEDAYITAKNRVMTGKPSQLGKAIIEDLCTCTPKLSSPCCARIVWGMYRESLPVIVRNHIADMTFSKDTYKEIFKKSDQVFDSNQNSDPRNQAVVAAVQKSTSPTQNEVAATSAQRGNGRGGRGYRGGGRGFRGGGRGGAATSSNPTTPHTNTTTNNTTPTASGQSQKGPRHATAKGESEKLCKIHYRWGENGSYCAAPWVCPMKNVFKAPQ